MALLQGRNSVQLNLSLRQPFCSMSVERPRKHLGHAGRAWLWMVLVVFLGARRTACWPLLMVGPGPNSLRSSLLVQRASGSRGGDQESGNNYIPNALPELGQHPDRHCFSLPRNQSAKSGSCVYKCIWCGDFNKGVGLESGDRCNNCNQGQVEHPAFEKPRQEIELWQARFSVAGAPAPAPQGAELSLLIQRFQPLCLSSMLISTRHLFQSQF